jgi:hypothetical protein
MTTLSIGGDNVIELRGLKNAITGDPITTATVTVTVTEDITGAEVSGQSWPLTMPHIASGTYRAILPDVMDLNSALSYTSVVVADNGTDQKGRWCTPYTASCSR